MSRWWLVLLLLSGCVHGQFTQRGDLRTSTQVDRRETREAPVVRVDDGTARLTVGSQTCVDFRNSYLQNTYERRQYPAHVITPIGLLLGAAGALTGLISSDPSFLWPETRPAITPVSYLVGLTAGLVGLAAGLLPMALGAGETKAVLLREERSTRYDEVETTCSQATSVVPGPLPFRAWLQNDKVKGLTGSVGTLTSRDAAIAALGGTRFTPSTLREWSEDSMQVVNFELGDTPKQVKLVDLYELRFRAPRLRDECSKTCLEGGGARVCQRREAICLEVGGELELCAEMRNTCLELESPNPKGFLDCFDGCVKRQLPAVFSGP